MAGIVERISIIVDSKVDGATQGFKKLKADIAEADGVAAKFKAGWSGVASGVKANAGMLAASAGAALVSFGVKAVGAFQDSAIAAGQFADATGIAVNDASRWREVAGDVGVSADALQGAFQKMNKSIADGAPSWAEYGVQIVKTGDGVVDANATFQNAITTIGAIADPTLRAKAAQEVFGKSYGQVAELMEMSAGDLKDALDGVGDAQVIDDKELAKAKKFRDTMDRVSDSLQGVQMAAGEALVGVVNFIEDATRGAEELGRAIRRSLDSDADRNWTIVDSFRDAEAAAAGFDMSLLDNAHTMDEVRAKVMALTDSEHAANLVALEWAHSQGPVADGLGNLRNGAGELVNANGDLIDSNGDLIESAGDVADELDELTGAAKLLDDTLKKLDKEEATLDLADQFDDLKAKADEAFYAGVSGAEDAEQAQRDYQKELVATKQRVAEYATEVLGLPPEKVTQILAEIDQGNIADVEAELARLGRTRSVAFIAGVGNFTDPGTPKDEQDFDAPAAPGGGPMKLESTGGTRSGGAPSVSLTLNISGPVMGGDQMVVDMITRAVNDGVRAAWMAAP